MFVYPFIFIFLIDNDNDKLMEKPDLMTIDDYINLLYENECVFACLYFINDWTDFLEIFTVSACMSGRTTFYVEISNGRGDTPTYTTLLTIVS